MIVLGMLIMQGNRNCLVCRLERGIFDDDFGPLYGRHNYLAV